MLTACLNTLLVGSALDLESSGVTAPPAPAVREAARVGLVAFVANPTKRGAEDVRRSAVVALTAIGAPEPLWFETTADDPGVGQAREALALGASLVVAVGGDGTARAVAQALSGTSVPIGLIPLGTGNMLARNLGVPIADPRRALEIALTGQDRAIDVGWLRAGPASDAPEHAFLVMAGIGFDAALIEAADTRLKARFGWFAYVIAGVRHSNARRLRGEMDVDGGSPLPLRVRSILIGNFGQLPAGMNLLPDAHPDDGWLDVGALGTRAGLLGWAGLITQVVRQSAGRRPRHPMRVQPLRHGRAQVVRVRADRLEAVQADGDVLGHAREVTARVDPRALAVRVP